MTNDSSSLIAATTRPPAQQTWWQKPLIWGIFLCLIYVLRDFFLIGFLTFLFCFIVRSLVGVLTRRLAPSGHASRGLDLFLTICVFFAILLSLYGLGRLFVPQVIRQGKSLLTQMKALNAAQVQNAVLAKTVGSWEFDRQFGMPQDPRYQKGLAEFHSDGQSGEGLYQMFPGFRSRLQAEFEANYVSSDPEMAAQLNTEGSPDVSAHSLDEFRASPSYQAEFKKFYEAQANETPETVPIDYALFQTLEAAYPRGKQAFLEAVRQHDGPKQESVQESVQESLTHQQLDFESAKKLEFGQQWWASSHVADWVRDHATSDGPKLLQTVVKWFEERLGDLFRLPIQIGTAFLLAVFILIEWEGVKSGVAGLRSTRVQPIYDEIAPGLIALGKLIGKSFQGQMLIALINSCLTFVALWWIGVEYKFVLALMVFLFSFIPVFGVILSGGPICAIAILQPGGSLWMVAQVLIAIAIMHLIESMFLSPRILGKIGHLHPVLVIVILLVAEKFFGMWGLVLGVPVAIYIIRVVILDSPIPGIYEPENYE